MSNVFSILEDAARANPDGTAVIDLGEEGSRPRSMTYKELHHQVLLFATRLHELDCAPGQTTALFSGNSLDFIIAWFGVLAAGNTILPIPGDRKQREITFKLENGDCSALVFDESLFEEAYSAIGSTPKTVVPLDLQSQIRQADGYSELVEPHQFADSDPAMIIYTSGTTKNPKGVRISHGSILVHGVALSERLELTEDDIILGALPLGLSYCCRVAMLGSIRALATFVVKPKFRKERALEIIDTYGITFFPGAPANFIDLSSGDYEPPNSLRFCLSAGAPLTAEQTERAEAKLGCPIIQGYGLTEAHFCVMDLPESRMPGSAGKPLGGVEIIVVDENMEELPEGEYGHILVRGPNLMLGYIDDEMQMHNGFMLTKDGGYLDEDGRLVIVGRLDDMIIVGAVNVSPTAVESLALELPWLRQSAAIGVDEERLGKVIGLFIVVEDGHEADVQALVDFVFHNGSPAMTPRYYALIDELPMTSTDKLSRSALQKLLNAGTVSWQEAPRAFK